MSGTLQSHAGRHVGHVRTLQSHAAHLIDYRLVVRRKRPWCMCQVHVQCRICHGGALSTVRGAAAVRRLSHVTHVTRALRESGETVSQRAVSSRRCPVTNLYWFVCGLLTSRARLTEGEECVESRSPELRSVCGEGRCVTVCRVCEHIYVAPGCRLPGCRRISESPTRIVEHCRASTAFEIYYIGNPWVPSIVNLRII